MSETKRVKVHRVEVLVIDHDGLGEYGMRDVLENQRYPNWCMSPRVKRVETREVDWSDEHPLNQRATSDEAYRDLFGVDDLTRRDRDLLFLARRDPDLASLADEIERQRRKGGEHGEG